jgi:cob(I)alamin adenosyltransferase
MKIYTKTGDKGKTSLFDGTRVNKDTIRLETYGTFDELSSILGIAQSFLKEKKLVKELQAIQKDLLDIGAHLANPQNAPSTKFLTYLDERVGFFEKSIDSMTENLTPLRSFILFTGNTPSCFLQLSRSVARRSERRLVSLSQKESVDAAFIRYFNRLSDLLYTMGRFANRKNKAKEVVWKPFI